MAERPIWYKQPGEGAAQYAAFSLYRDAGEDRSIARVAAAAVTAKSPRSHHQRRYLTHPRPEVYLRSIERCWKRWSTRWEWVKRARAYDDHLAEVAQERAFEAALASRQAEIEENERQRRLRREEARAARAVGRRGLLRILQEIEGQQLDSMKLKELIPHLKRFLEAVTEGQRLERLEEGEPTELTAEVSQGLSTRLAGMIHRYVPKEQWEKVAAEMDQALGLWEYPGG